MNRFVSIAATLTLAMPMFAQIAGAPAADQVGDFTVERVLTLSSVASPQPPSFPPPVLAGLQNGTLEVHQVFVYNSATKTLEQTTFVVPGKSPLPFPNPGAAPLADHYIIQVDTTAKTPTSAVLTGHVTSNDTPTPWGNITGALVTIAFGYRSSGASAQFSGIMESVSGVYGLYTAAGVGSLADAPTAGKCSMATLNGVYMFRLNGFQSTAGSFLPYVDNGRFIADGNGNMKILHTGNSGGQAFTNGTILATYALDDYCSGTIKWPGASMDLQVSRDGRQANLVFTSPSSLVANGSGSLQ